MINLDTNNLKDQLSKVMAVTRHEDNFLKAYAAAGWVLGCFMGRDWLVKRWLSAGKADYLRLSGNIEHPPDQVRTHMLRTIDVAEMLLELQGVENFSTRLKTLQTDSVESICGELEVGFYLKVRSAPFRYMGKNTGTKGMDYDMEVLLNSLWVPAEIKTKLEDEPVTHISIGESVKRAKRQLPDSRGSLIFVRVPQAMWTQETAEKSILEIQSRLSTTDRIGAAIMMSRIYLPIEGNEIESNFVSCLVPNQNCPYFQEEHLYPLSEVKEVLDISFNLLDIVESL